MSTNTAKPAEVVSQPPLQKQLHPTSTSVRDNSGEESFKMVPRSRFGLVTGFVSGLASGILPARFSPQKPATNEQAVWLSSSSGPSQPVVGAESKRPSASPWHFSRASQSSASSQANNAGKVNPGTQPSRPDSAAQGPATIPSLANGGAAPSSANSSSSNAASPSSLSQVSVAATQPAPESILAENSQSTPPKKKTKVQSVMTPEVISSSPPDVDEVRWRGSQFSR